MKRIVFILSTILLLNHSMIQSYPLRKMLPSGILALISIYEVANIWTTSYFCGMPDNYHYKDHEMDLLYRNECPAQFTFRANSINYPAIVGALMSLFFLCKELIDKKNYNKKMI